MGPSGRPVLLFDVLAQDRDRCPAGRSSEVRPGPQASRPPVVLPQVRDSCRSRREDTPLRLLTSREMASYLLTCGEGMA
jgi:hypothetical protein